ncbi:hypothetical protein PDUR_21365 [Paenibacillus durus]|uniref:Uncharacterized protein n=2 Tax=Paenibacillus durus TaxID=44251 RepID=A0A089IYZ4_PAEDU|nr:hypothetical protein PDUR_21365 [Paenibacillus durus]
MQCPDVSGNLLRFRCPNRKTSLPLSKIRTGQKPLKWSDVYPIRLGLSYEIRSGSGHDNRPRQEHKSADRSGSGYLSENNG